VDIGVVIPRLDGVGGGERFLVEVLRRWVDDDLTVYSRFFDEGLVAGVNADFVRVNTVLPGNPAFNVFHHLVMRDFERQMGRHDVYFSTLSPTHLIDRHPMVWYPQEPSRMLYDLYPELMVRADIPFYRKAILRALFPLLRRLDSRVNSDVILANSKYSAGYIEGVYGRAVDGIVYMGVDNVADSPSDERGGYILSVGRLTSEKRVDLAIGALGFLPEHVRLKIVGVGPHRAYLERLAVEVGVDGRVDFLGVKFGDELNGIYQRAVATVFTPLREPFGLVPLESLSNGTPVIGCREGGFTEVLSDGRDCFLVEPTEEEIAGKVRQLLQSPGLIEQMGESGIRKAGGYSWDETAGRIRDYLLLA
jgi:glycosyltransferase involved in cell wall biosynthesis